MVYSLVQTVQGNKWIFSLAVALKKFNVATSFFITMLQFQNWLYILFANFFLLQSIYAVLTNGIQIAWFLNNLQVTSIQCFLGLILCKTRHGFWIIIARKFNYPLPGSNLPTFESRDKHSTHCLLSRATIKVLWICYGCDSHN